MSNVFASSWVVDLLTNLAVSLILFAVGYALGKRRERQQLAGRNFEQYDCYPFAVDPDGFPAFSPELFARAIDELLSRPDATAAAQLIVLGEQNGVRLSATRKNPDVTSLSLRLFHLAVPASKRSALGCAHCGIS